MSNKYIGFKILSIDEQKNISAGFGINGIISTISTGSNLILDATNDISNIIIKNKIINKMDEIDKGEIELGKDGQIRLKWDSTSNTTLNIPKIIF